jgi:hypothetical protein
MANASALVCDCTKKESTVETPNVGIADRIRGTEIAAAETLHLPLLAR